MFEKQSTNQNTFGKKEYLYSFIWYYLCLSTHRYKWFDSGKGVLFLQRIFCLSFVIVNVINGRLKLFTESLTFTGKGDPPNRVNLNA